MNGIGPDTLDCIKNSLSPRELAERAGLRIQGKRCFCPVCQDMNSRTPDLDVGRRDSWMCYKCNSGGDVIELARHIHNCSFRDAVAYLGNLIGLSSVAPHECVPPRQARHIPSTHRFNPEDKSHRHIRSEVLGTFLAGCRPILDVPEAVRFLEDKAISQSVMLSAWLMFCGREYHDLLEELRTEFAPEDLELSGLFTDKAKGFRPVWDAYFQQQRGFILIPYVDGHPERWDTLVSLKARLPLSKPDAEEEGIRSRMMHTSGGTLSLYCVDNLRNADEIYIAEGETDTLAAVSAGLNAVGVPGSGQWKDHWTPLFHDAKSVCVLQDADGAGEVLAHRIADSFVSQGLPLPDRIPLENTGCKDVSDFYASVKLQQTC